MRGLILLFFIAFTLSWPAAAQQAGADYAISNIRLPRFAPDNSQVFIEFDIVNFGSAATVPATILLVNVNTGQELARETLPPLEAESSTSITLSFQSSLLAAGTPESLRISVGIDEVEPESSATIANNQARVNVTVPGAGTNAPNNPESTPEATFEPSPISTPADTIPIFGIQIDTSDPATLAILAGIIGAALILLLIIIVILRLIFQRPPAFGAWQPPYANVPWLDPNTTQGRRQGWQQYAQNDFSPFAPPTEGATYVRKLLTGLDGEKLGNWRVMGLRISQYDQYGRVARSQIILSKRQSRRVDGIAKRAQKLNADQLGRKLRPVARSLANQLRKKVSARSAMLPLALDVRFQGVHGEVHIFFELYMAQQGHWRQVDRWEPEMTVTDRIIRESFTYTLFGQHPGESMKDFPRRLQDDLVNILVEMIRHPDHSSQPTPGGGIDRVNI
jgi:hypothetical protein